jgi:hypothetical protein
MNILPFHLNIPAQVILERPEGTLVQGRYGDRVMFTLADGRVMYVPPFVANQIQAEGAAAGERFELCKTQVKKGSRRAIEWIVRRLDPSEPEPEPEPEPEAPLERDLRASLESVEVKKNANGHSGPHPNSQPAPATKLEHALKTAISAAYNAERYGAELGYVVRFDADAIKSMAITVLINMSGGNQR